MNQPVKVLVIQKAAAGWLVQTVGGRAPHYANTFQFADQIPLKQLVNDYLETPLPPQPETPPKDGE